MKQAKELYEALKNIMGDTDQVLAGIVTTVDKNNCICTITMDELEMGGIQLRATIETNKKGITFFPKIGSNVLVQRLGSKETWFVTMVSEVEEVLFEIGDTRFDMAANGFELKKDGDTLKEVLELLIEAVQQIVVLQGRNPNYGKLLESKNKLNNLMQ